MKLSLIVPTYNTSGTIVRCLDSVFSQASGHAVEVIAVDDVSTDDTLARLHAYQFNHDGLQVVIPPQKRGNQK